jgi:membrane protein implicated in regulation of membrane protease activity
MRNAIAGLASALVIAAAVVVAVLRFAAIDATSHSASDTLRPWLIQVAAIAVLAVVAIAILQRGLRGHR